MALRKQFMQIIADVRAELGRSTDPAVGAADLPAVKQAISRSYESLYDEYDWPHLTQIFDRIPLQAGERYYDFPAEMDFDQMERVAIWWNNVPSPMCRGIGFDQYAVYSSDDGIRADPATNWDVRFVDTKEMLEVWPIPASNVQSIQFKGICKFKPLVDDADLCLLDDVLVTLFAAIALAPKTANIQEKISSAQERLARLKAKSAAASPTVRLGLGGASGMGVDMPSRVVIRVH